MLSLALLVGRINQARHRLSRAFVRVLVAEPERLARDPSQRVARLRRLPWSAGELHQSCSEKRLQEFELLFLAVDVLPTRRHSQIGAWTGRRMAWAGSLVGAPSGDTTCHCTSHVVGPVKASKSAACR